MKSADLHNKAELEKAIGEAEARIKELENALTNAEFNLNLKDKELDSAVSALTTAIIIIGVVAGVGFVGCAALGTWIIISRHKQAAGKSEKE